VAPRERRVIWTESARLALDEVIAYIAIDSRANALRVLEAAFEAARHLSTFAERGRMVPESSHPDIREVFVFRYRLMYRVESDSVEIRAFIHGARDFAALRTNQEGE
jgi:toxin ParE1/3/4